MRTIAIGLASAAALALSVNVAAAHPHIIIDAKVRVVFNDAGELTAIKNTWTFDKLFSAWQVQGLDTNGDGIVSSDEMQELANENVAGLAEYSFYTLAGEGNSTLRFASMDDAKFVHEDGSSTLTFGIEPQEPYRIKGRFELAIADPEYYVAIAFADMDTITLENAPEGCTLGIQPGRELSPELQERLGDLSADVRSLPKDLEVAVRGAQGAIIIDCSGAVAPLPAATALEAVTQVAETKPPPQPFGGPPPEPGFKMPRTGFLGGVAKVMEESYKALGEAVTALKTDWTSFWVLGGLSFLYGVLHAAGPGHGKVVIGSYMLANERQARRGIFLSFAAAMMQSLVAVVFFGIAAAFLGLSANAMYGAVGWIDKVSYGLIVLLGLWLVARRLFGWGHSHAAPNAATVPQARKGDTRHALLADTGGFRFEPGGAAAAKPDAYGRLPGHAHYGHNHGDDGHEHDHSCAHNHMVTPAQTGGDWREQLGVVLTVGIRPCSGALAVLVLSYSIGVLPAGIAAVFLMGLGTAITVSILAIIAVSAKDLARRLVGADDSRAARMLWWAELVGALVVLAFGLLLLIASLQL